MAKNKSSVNVAIVVLPALITAIAGVIAAYFSYSAGVEAVRIPLNATQTAETEAGLSGNAPVASNINIPIAIDSTPGWHPTGMTVKKGDFVKIEVVAGKWTAYREPFPEDVRNQLSEEANNELSYEIFMNWYPATDGSGDPSEDLCEAEDNCPLLGQKTGGLVALIGKAKYFIGNKCVFIATDSGQIFLQINDNPKEPTGNFGVLAVTVEFSDIYDSTNPISSGCGMPNP